MTISSLHYKAHELRVYTQQDFPFHRDPYASGDKRFSAVVAIGTLPPSDAPVHRYALDCAGPSPTSAAAAVARALQYGKDVIDGKVQAQEL